MPWDIDKINIKYDEINSNPKLICLSAFLHRDARVAMRDTRGTSKSCPRHSGTNSNTSVLNQSIVGGRPDSVQVDSPPRQRPYVTVETSLTVAWGKKVPQSARACICMPMGTFWRIVHDQSPSFSISPNLSFASTIVRHPKEREKERGLYTWTPGGFRYEITAALMDSEVATISMRRNNVTLIYLRFNPVGFA